ncbi:hypothetical protein GCM10020221_04620 [Streptomyces thioluteus]|uniref:Alpha-N-acetylglucosaminidase tim-barrel domain-containing protein n=1 Tax=Streptomyces thioluteus TaxID=66431 RepID=A0ABN3WG89_STRTU
MPPGFADRHDGARTVPQGDWAGFRRPDWLDPRTPHFTRVARTFYRVQQELLGPTSMYKMDLLHEGGTPGPVPVGAAARAVEKALRTAHTGRRMGRPRLAEQPPPRDPRRRRPLEDAHPGRHPRPLPVRHGPREGLGRHAVRLRHDLELRRAHGDGRQHPRLGLPLPPLAHQAGQAP